MSIEELKNILESTGLPVRYRAFRSVAPMPCIVFFESRAADFYADDKPFFRVSEYDIELYSDDKDPASEALVETALINAGIAFDSVEDYINSEKCNRVTYTIEV